MNRRAVLHGLGLLLPVYGTAIQLPCGPPAIEGACRVILDFRLADGMHLPQQVSAPRSGEGSVTCHRALRTPSRRRVADPSCKIVVRLEPTGRAQFNIVPGEYVFSAVVKINDGLVLVEEALTVRGDLEAKFNASPPLERGDVRLAIDCDGEPAEGKFEVFVNSSLTSRMLEYTGRPPGGGLISSTAQVYPLSKPEVAIPVRLLDCFVIVVPPDSELAAASIHRVVHERGSRLDPPRLVHSCVAPGWLELSVTVEAPSASEEHQPWGAGTLHRDSHRRNLSAPLLHLGSEAVLDANYYPRDGDDPDVRTRELEPGQTYRSYWLPPGDYAVHPS